MFNFRKETKQEKEEIKIEQVKCRTCKHYIDKVDAQRIFTHIFGHEHYEYFCPMHKKPYDGYTSFEHGSEIKSYFYKVIPKHYQEVDEKGREIKTKTKK